MNGKELLTLMKNGKSIYGTLILSSSPYYWPMVVKKTGIDFVFIVYMNVELHQEELVAQNTFVSLSSIWNC